MVSSILVVDDSRLQCEHAATLCRRLVPTADIQCCHDGSEALDHLRVSEVDIVVLDLEMPVMDGVLLASHIANEQLAKGIIISSSKDPKLIASVGTMSESSGLAVLGTLQKPIQESCLQNSFAKFSALKPRSTAPAAAAARLPEITAEELAAAIANDEIEVYYQPKLTTRGLLLKGVEALARWKHPLHGFIPPPVFIDLAEKTSQINALTLKLFQRGVQDMQACEQRGLRLTWSFNLSPQSIADSEFSKGLADILDSAVVNASNVIFEVTENMLLENRALSLQALARLRLYGFGLSIDDFGTGFANAEQLAMLPATELKIDRSLIDGVSKKWQQREILESTVRLAKNLQLTTVAEGVEELEDYLLLKALEVDLVQGYYFARPMPIDALFDWITGELSDLRNQTKNLVV